MFGTMSSALACSLIARMPGIEGALPVNSVTALVDIGFTPGTNSRYDDLSFFHISKIIILYFICPFETVFLHPDDW